MSWIIVIITVGVKKGGVRGGWLGGGGGVCVWRSSTCANTGRELLQVKGHSLDLPVLYVHKSAWIVSTDKEQCIWQKINLSGQTWEEWRQAAACQNKREKCCHRQHVLNRWHSGLKQRRACFWALGGYQDPENRDLRRKLRSIIEPKHRCLLVHEWKKSCTRDRAMLAVSVYLVATTSSSGSACTGATPPTWHLKMNAKRYDTHCLPNTSLERPGLSVLY